MESLGRRNYGFTNSRLCIRPWTYGAATLKARAATLVCHWLGWDEAQAC